MKKVLFLIHDLGPGGAEKVLINLVNNLDKYKYDITLIALFAGGVHENEIPDHVTYLTCFKYMLPGNSHIMKCFSPGFLHKKLIKGHFDIEVSFLEGPSCRIISGCPFNDTKLVTWVHCTPTVDNIKRGFRSIHEAHKCYKKYSQTICVSLYSWNLLTEIFPDIKVRVLYNVNDTDKILKLSGENS